MGIFPINISIVFNNLTNLAAKVSDSMLVIWVNEFLVFLRSQKQIVVARGLHS